ncbi:uncharacterized protein LOC110752903 [Prunus avium]|uniref:Uncharacterized protein LOC110752903 n=1 Tax=Prunus avium TaxID=42229 RepID=A0A6P5S752_PRUAV|nr:uncharacterized protein LOC110752903 [Prunus avium]
MWSIWKARCKAVFEHLRPNPLEVLHGAREAWSEFFQNEVCPGTINRVGGDEGVVNPSLTWCAPPNPFLKLNVDASWQNASGLAGLAIIIRNHMGEFKYGKVLKTTTGSIEIAEARAIIEGLSFALEHGITRVCVESDSRNVIDNCSGKIARGDWGMYPSLCSLGLDPKRSQCGCGCCGGEVLLCLYLWLLPWLLPYE